ncbi:hypothetical protein WR25_24288 [Diploscapter pachys]|uniref:VWFA domain-containing protein n=1 Tax=Diploscapter pachys TaxID=2018661 RepID=A0A2A2J763_9BILA|nr:hypothetical protein WR25_24288 [Diploscapter pachys]
MGHDGLNSVAANAATVFAQSNITQTLGQTTRVGIVTYGQSAVVQYNLTAFDDTNTFISKIFDVCNKPTTDTESDIYTGLYVARDALQNGRMNGKRDNVRQAIILYASDYKAQGLENDPVQLAQNIKANGIDIITVAFNQFGDKGVLAKLAKLATPGMAFSNTETDLVGEIQRNGLCQINCFCPNAWTQYTSQFGLASARRFAVCLQFGSISSMWVATRIDCQHMDNSAYLVSEFDEAKHNFTYQLFKSESDMPSPYIYHTGLSWDVSSQRWIPDGAPEIAIPYPHDMFANYTHVIRIITVIEHEDIAAEFNIFGSLLISPPKYNLTAFDDTNTLINTIFDVCNKPTTDTESDISTGLYAAVTVLYDGRVNGKRDNVRQVIILYASAYKAQGLESDPVHLAQQIKEDGISIITVGFSQFGGNLLAGLAKLASPGMAFNDTSTDLVGEVQRNGLCHINCFCPIAWTQYTSQFGLANARRQGISNLRIYQFLSRFALCLKLGDIDKMWVAAKIDCQNMDNSAYLVSEFDEAKHNFTYQFFKSKSGIPSPYIYHTGLSWDVSSQQWMWEQPVAQRFLIHSMEPRPDGALEIAIPCPNDMFANYTHVIRIITKLLNQRVQSRRRLLAGLLSLQNSSKEAPGRLIQLHHSTPPTPQKIPGSR